jgi:TonB-dependent receptor
MVSFMLPLSILFSQESGKIYGIVTDQSTGEALIGANITLKGTSLGTSSGIDGKYTLYPIPSGSYTLVARYIGYKGQEFPIEVKAGSNLEKIFSLVTQAIEGEEVIVTAQAKGQKSAINQQLSSNTISSVVSSERIHELPDASAAAALSRLPGVSLQDGDKVVIRGIQAKLNTILINGIQLPSTDINNRSTSLGFISSNMLSGIEVIKTLTPDMDANTIGGTVNLRLREAPSDFHADVFAQGNFNNQDKTTDNYKSWVSVSDRFLDDKLGVFIQGNADRSNGGADKLSASYGGTYLNGDNWHFGNLNNFTLNDEVNINSTNGVSIILDYVLPHGKIVMQNTYAHNLNNNITYQEQLFISPNNYIDYHALRNKYGRDIYMNALQGEYYFGDVKAEFTASHSYTNQYTYIRYGDNGENFNFNNHFDNPNNPINTNEPFIDASGKRIDYNDPARLAFNFDTVYNIRVNPMNADSASLSGWAMLRAENFYQHLYNTSVDITIPVAFSSDFSSKFKIGGKFYRTTRNNIYTSWFTGTGDDDLYAKVHNFVAGKYLNKDQEAHKLMFVDVMDKNYAGGRGKYFLGGKYDFTYALDRDKYDEFITLSRTGWAEPAIHYANTFANTFDGSEMFSAGYIMGTFDIGSKLTILGGVRFEHYNMKYHAIWDYVTHSVYGDAVPLDTLNRCDRNDDNVFPNVQVRYKITDWADIRVAYSKGISRPDYNAIAPRTYYARAENVYAGNPLLKPAVSTNIDLALSAYSDKLGLFTISPYYKEIVDMFYYTSIYYSNLSSFNVSFPDSAFFTAVKGVAPNASEKIGSYINNSNPGYLRGLEIDWQTNFWYLPKPLNALVLNINYTKTWSDMAYNQVNNSVGRVKDTTNPAHPIYRNIYLSKDTVYHARLLNQADNVLNIAVGIDYKDFSARISFNMQGNVVTYIASDAQNREGDQYTGNIYRWDFTIQQKLPIPGLSIMLSGENIFHNPQYTYQKFKLLGSSVPTEQVASVAYYPSIFELTLRYSM